MELREAKIFSFGKLQNRAYAFAPGINVICGDNEAGKSTLHAFLMGMLFGMEKSRGRAAKEDYARYEPWHAPAYYSGALRFSVEGRPFYLERNFYHREKREVLRNEADGEELSVAYGDLTMLLGGIGKEIYGNTYDISQSGAAAGKELAGMLAEYLANASEGGNGDIHVAQALELLHAKKKELNAELRNVQTGKTQKKNVLRTEQTVLEQDYARLSREMEAERQEWIKVREALAQEEVQSREAEGERSGEAAVGGTEQVTNRTAEQDTRAEGDAGAEEKQKRGGWKLPSVIAGVSACGACAILGGLIGGGDSESGGVMTLAAVSLLVIAAVCGMITAIRFRGVKRAGAESRKTDYREDNEWMQPEMQEKQAETARRQAETARQQAEAAGQQAKRLFLRMQESLEEKETRLYNIREQLEELEVPGQREREIASDLEALVLAAEEITRLAGEYGEKLSDVLSREVSRYVSLITDGKYDRVRVDEKGGLLVQTDGKEVPPDALSRGTLEQFYLAFRLAVGNIVTREEQMPILLDETFAMYDDERLGQTLRMLAGLPNQILIFTCQKREAELLEELEIPHHTVKLGKDE